ncbi:hypothetical protein TNCV_1029941 [Trichonephila clavipes]|nr:hypothetical protein TNCV_1029941 [Trichonephila clavipes]
MHTRYKERDLLPYLTLQPLVNTFLMRDVDKSYRSQFMQNTLEAEAIQYMEYPEFSPKLNLIYHVWENPDDTLKRDQRLVFYP